MKFTKRDLLTFPNGIVDVDEDLQFEKSDLTYNNKIRGIKDLHVSGQCRYETSSELFYTDLKIECILILPCAISLEDIEYPLSTTANQIYAFSNNVEDDQIHVKGNVVNLMPEILQAILMEVPFKVTKENVVYPTGKNWQVIKECDYSIKEEDEIDPRLAKLLEFKNDND
ncbi:MAG: DUF177 domain-containing protein [Erysipelotrichaceae bacterium]